MLNPDYTRKSARQWIDEMYRGELALADFQRSRVWSPELVSRYLKAILTGQPTGTLLMVEPGEDLQGRPIDGNPADISQVTTLILDGQQRLTSLWHGLMDAGERSYFIKVKNIAGRDLDLCDIESHPKTYRNYDSVEKQFSADVIPVKILYDPPNGPDSKPTRLERWCERAVTDSTTAGNLRRAIEQRMRKPLDRYNIWYATFTGIKAHEAVKIFVETNSSSERVKAFDLAVAQAVEIRSDINLRSGVEQLRVRHDRIKYYFSQDRHHWISDIGEYLLKVACLMNTPNGKPPKDSNFEDAVKYLFESGTENVDAVEANLNEALLFLENNGVPTRDFLPRVPAIYVIAALQRNLEGLHETRRGQAISLITKYLWWSFLSDRYESQANDKLHQDYRRLCGYLEYLNQNGELPSTATMFMEGQLPTTDQLTAPRDAFGSKTPLGKAITALNLNNGAKDWVTGEELTPGTVRRLESESPSQLDRHHVFPRQALTRGEGSLDPKDPLINHGLNIVPLRKRANITLSGKEPAVYLKRLLETIPNLTNEELGRRITSHIIPYDLLLTQEGSIKDRYNQFLTRRAEMLCELFPNVSE